MSHPEESRERPTVQPRLPKSFFVDSREESVGELTLDTSTLKEVWGDQHVALSLASMLKAVVEGSVSSTDGTDTSDPSTSAPAAPDSDSTSTEEEEEENDGDDEPEEDVEAEELDDDSSGSSPEISKSESPGEGEKQARLALVEVFECFCGGMTPRPTQVHVLNVDSLLSRKQELSEARKVVPGTAADEKTNRDSSMEEGGNSPPTVVLRCVEDGKKLDVRPIDVEGEEETISKLLDLVSTMRRKHKLPPLGPSSSGVNPGNDDHAMTFGIVTTDCSSSKRRDPDEEWLFVGRETAGLTQTALEESIYPIRSIYSFFVVLNSDSVVQSTPSPSSSQEESEDSSSISSSSSASLSNDEDGQQESSSTDATVFSAVKKHEDSAWSILAAIHAASPEGIDGSSSTGPSDTVCPDLVVVDDPLCIINEYIRYLQGDESPPPGERKRRRVHVHEKIVGRKMCRIRILTSDEESKENVDESMAEQREKRKELFQAKLLQEQQELLHLLEDKLRKLQQSQEFNSAVTTTSSSSSSDSSSPSPSSSPEQS